MPGVPRLIHRHLPDVRLIFILRNPLERAYSDYLRQRVDGIEQRTFERAIEEELSRPRETPLSGTNYYVRNGLYAQKLDRFLEFFPSSQLKVMFFDDLKTMPAAFLRSILEFIGVGQDSEIDTSLQYHGAGTMLLDRMLRVLGLKSVSRVLHRLPPRLFHVLYRQYTRLPKRPGARPELSSGMRERLKSAVLHQTPCKHPMKQSNVQC